jgi:hypothetical protein
MSIFLRTSGAWGFLIFLGTVAVLFREIQCPILKVSRNECSPGITQESFWCQPENMTPTYSGTLTRTRLGATAFAFGTELCGSEGGFSTWRLSSGSPGLHPVNISDTKSRARLIMAFKFVTTMGYGNDRSLNAGMLDTTRLLLVPSGIRRNRNCFRYHMPSLQDRRKSVYSDAL